MLKWVGLVVCVLIAAMWFFSLFSFVSWVPTFYAASYGGKIFPRGFRAFRLADGAIERCDQSGISLRAGWHCGRTNGIKIRWRPHWHRYHPGRVIPLWIPFVLAALPTAAFWWRDRRLIPPGHCQRCAYDLMGNVSGVCPECGRRV